MGGEGQKSWAWSLDLGIKWRSDMNLPLLIPIMASMNQRSDGKLDLGLPCL